MTFDEYEQLPNKEWWQVTNNGYFQAGAASRDAEVQRLQMALADAEALELGTAEKCNQLRTELVKALAACKAKDEALESCGFDDDSTDPEMCGSYYDAELVQRALDIQPDDSALKAWLGEPVSYLYKHASAFGYGEFWSHRQNHNGVTAIESKALYSPKLLK